MWCVGKGLLEWKQRHPAILYPSIWTMDNWNELEMNFHTDRLIKHPHFVKMYMFIWFHRIHPQLFQWTAIISHCINVILQLNFCCWVKSTFQIGAKSISKVCSPHSSERMPPHCSERRPPQCSERMPPHCSERRPPNCSERGLRTVRKWVSEECGG